ARVRERLCRAARDAKAAAENLPFARHHDFAPMTSPTRVASHSTDRKPNSVRALKLITATTACQVKLQLRRTRAGHSCENWTVVIAASYHGKSTAVCRAALHQDIDSLHRRAVDTNRARDLLHSTRRNAYHSAITAMALISMR